MVTEDEHMDGMRLGRIVLYGFKMGFSNRF
jgi:hypothetical protein